MEYEQITMFEVLASLEGNGARPSHKGSGIGDKDVSYTLNATEQHAIALSEVHAPLSAMDGPKGVHSQAQKSPEDNYILEPRVFGIGSKDSNAMKSDNPHSGIYEADTTRTLDLNGGNPACNQGGMAVVETIDVRISSTGTKNQRAHCYETNIARSLSTGGDDPDSNQGGVAIIEYQDVCGTLAASDYKFPQQQQVEEGKCIVEVSEAIKDLNKDAPHQQDLLNDPEGVAHTLAVGHHGASKHLTKTVVKQMDFENNRFASYKETEMGGTLKASGGDYPGGETLHEANYLVRRLTPIECERLQGMPDMWCYGVENENPTDEEIVFWIDAFETHRKIISGAQKPKTEKQIRKFIGKPLNDSAVYKIQGNGIALPNAWFVLDGVSKALKGEI